MLKNYPKPSVSKALSQLKVIFYDNKLGEFN